MLSKFLVTRSQTNQFQNWLKLQESGIAHSATFTFYQEIVVINFLPWSIYVTFTVTFTFTDVFMSLSLSKMRSKLYFHSLSKYHHIALALHWRHSNFCSLARPEYQSFEIEKQHWLDFGWLRKLSKRKCGIGSKKTLLDHISKILF